MKKNKEKCVILKTLAIILFSCFVLIGCATRAKYVAKLNTWLGKDISEFIYKAGPPTSEYKMPDGNIMYTWHKTTGTSTIQYSTITSYYCNTIITASPIGKIISWRYEGNACRSY